MYLEAVTEACFNIWRLNMMTLAKSYMVLTGTYLRLKSVSAKSGGGTLYFVSFHESDRKN